MTIHTSTWKHGLTLALAIILSVALLAVTARAQESSPATEGEMGEMELPPGVALTVLTQIAPFELPDEPMALIFGRLSIEPGAEIPRHPHPIGEFGYVEAGSVSIHTFEGPPAELVRGLAAGPEATVETAGPGQELTAVAGDFAVVPPGNVSDTRAGDEGVTILIIEFFPLPAEGTPTS